MKKMVPLIAANWKLNKTLEEAVDAASMMKIMLSDVKDKEILICPPFIALAQVYNVIKGSNIMLGAQDVFWEEKGAFTGEVSPMMLKDVGCSYVIIGHSERREYFKETNEAVNKKVRLCIADELNAILCVGESFEQRQKKVHKDFVEKELEEGLARVKREDMKHITIAYEPIWAISSGDPNHKPATAKDAQEMHAFIRKTLANMFDDKTADSVRILYGGSMKPDNVKELMAKKDINGGLVGGASLEPESFARIVKGF
ncbi:MAG: triose-phosphate isomerase [Candidatus Woesearchaeota archaeon]|nr:triose-phosphate isomerase [Candidatus Woesearchaeota archaeon]